MRAIHLAMAAAGASLLMAGSAFAQTNLSPGGISAGAPKPPPLSNKPAEAPPAAVPGARARPDTVVPADRTTADLPPTEALFDAINRGDIASARDAVSRGADLDATNLLGLTPTELSVDLARNDITFLLLSLRGGGGGVHAPQQTADSAPMPAAVSKHSREPQHVARPVTQAAARTQAPPLFAGNGGAPNPSAGFLGFDAGR